MYTLFYCNNRFFIKCFRGFESTAENDNEPEISLKESTAEATG